MPSLTRKVLAKKNQTTPVATIQKFSNMVSPPQQPGVIGPQQPLTAKPLPSYTMPQPTPTTIPTTYGQPQPQYPQMPIGNIPPPTNVMQGLQTGTLPPLTNINEQRGNESLDRYYGNKPFEYNYETDPGFTAARNAAITGVKNRMPNRLYSSAADSMMTQAAMEVALPFRQQAYNEYNMNTGEMRNRIGTFQGAEDRLRNQEIAQYGVPLSPVARQYKTAYESMPPEMLNAVRAYQQDYAAEILRREKIDKNDPLLPYLYAARSMKIMSNPELMNKYSQDLAISAPGIAEMALKFDAAKMKNELDKLTVMYAPEKAKAEMDKLYAEIIKAVADGDKAQLDAAMKKLELANLPQKLVAEVNDIVAATQSKYAQAQQYNTAALENLSQVDLNREKLNTEKADQMKKLLESAKIKTESFDYQGFDRIDKFIQDQYVEDISTTEKGAGDLIVDGEGTTGSTTGGYQGNGTQTTKIKRIKAGAHQALAAYLLRLKANPDMDQDIVAALMAKYPIDKVIGGKKEVLK